VYLDQIDIEDFRSIATASVHLNRDLTVLVGENSRLFAHWQFGVRPQDRVMGAV
jgi:hypothetical protein